MSYLPSLSYKKRLGNVFLLLAFNVLMSIDSVKAVHVAVPCCLDFVQTDANFGPLLPNSVPGLVGELVYVNGNGCNMDAVQRGVRDPYRKVFMIERGGCSFAQKVLNAQKQGASAAIIYDNVYERIFSMMSNDEASLLVGIPSVFITREAAENIKQYHGQIVHLSRRDSLPYIHLFDPPFFVVVWMFLVTFFFVIFLVISVIVKRLCCCCPRPQRYFINPRSNEPSESAYMQFVDADLDESDEEDKERAPQTVHHIEDDDDEEDRASSRSKADTLNEPFLVSV